MWCSALAESDVIFGEKHVFLGICDQMRAFGERGRGIGQEARRGRAQGKRGGQQHGSTKAMETISL